MKKIKIVIYTLIFILMFNQICSMLKFKYFDGILSLEGMYEQENIDVLVLGSSHAFQDINTSVLYDEFGIAAYIAGGSIQPYWNTYYYLCEALDEHTPQLVLLEAYGSAFMEQYSDNSRIIKNNLAIEDICRRFESLSVSSSVDSFEDYVLNYRLWHSRYEELSEEDFGEYYDVPKYQYYKGFSVNLKTKEFEQPLVDDVIDTAPMTAKSEEYYRKIIELCQEKNIPIMVIVSPYILTEEQQKIYNYTGCVSEEYGIPFINFNSSYYYDEIGLDFQTDFADFSHLNYIGNVKFTRVLAAEIQSRFELEDRRENEEYSSYVSHSKDINRRIYNHELTSITSVTEFLNLISNEPDYYISFSFITDTKNEGMQSVLKLCPYLVDVIDTVQDNNVVTVEDGSVQVETDLVYKNTISMDSYVIQNSSTFVNTDDNIGMIHSLIVDGKEYIDDEHGCYVLVYDKFEETLVCVRQITYDKNGNLVLIEK